MFAIVVVVLTVIANLLISVVVLRKNPFSLTNQLVAALSIITALWTIFNFLALSPGSEEVRIFWVRTVMFVTASYGTVILLLSDVFPNSKLYFAKKSLIAIAVINLLNYSLAYSPYMFTHAQNNPDGSFNLYPGWAIGIYALGFMGFMTLGFIKLVKKLKSSTGLLRAQLRLFFTGLVVSFTLLTITNFVAVVVFRSMQLTYLGPPSTLILFAFVSYAIIRHKFLDITAIVARAVSYTFLLASVVIIEVFIFWIGTKILPVNIDRTLVAFVGSILIVMGYSSINSVITGLTDRIFFQGRYDSEEVLKKLTAVMVREVNIRRLNTKLLQIIESDIKLSSAAVILFKDHKVISVDSVGIDDKKIFEDAQLDKFIHQGSEFSIFEDLGSDEDKEIFRKLGISVLIPLSVKEEEIGLLALGPKSSGDIYASRDLEFFEIFAPQAAIAIRNAESYREIQEFNKTLEAKVDERTQELKQSQAQELKLKDEFVFIATHDLATPVTAISGFSALIKERKDKLPKELKDDLNAIAEASNRLKVLVNDLLQVARSDSGTIKVELVDVNAKDLIEAAVRQVGPFAKEKKVKIQLDLDPKSSIKADPRKLSEVFENLISNGVKYNKSGGDLTITSKLIGSKLHLTFKDTGLGIPLSEQGKVFTKFFRSEEPEVRQRPGTGLGLFVVRMLTEKMDGKITFESNVGEGTTFFLEFNVV